MLTLVVTCPPGFVTTLEGSCKCKDSAYAGLVSCEETQYNETSSRVASVLRGTWIGNYSDTILAGVSPYLLYSSNDTVILPDDWMQMNDDNYICQPVHRYGVLCGKCFPGYSQAVNGHDCVPCTNKESKYNWLLYLSLELVPMTLLFTLLLLFNIKITSGSGHAFIFYSQMITTTFDMSRDNVFGTVLPRPLILTYKLLYGIWNLDFFSILVSPFCLAPNMGPYSVLFLKFISACYPLLLIGCFSLIVWAYDQGWRLLVVLLRPVHQCLAWVQQVGKFRASAINAFAVFLVLSYTKFVFISFNILATNSLYDSAGNEIVSNLPYYDSTESFYNPKTVWLFILTIIILVILGAILPSTLLVPSTLRLLYKVSHSDCFSRCMPWGKVQEFLQQFHGCYKDGLTTNSYDYRCFSALFLFLRGIMFCLYSYSPSEGYQYALQTALCFLVTFLLASCRPFKESRDNVLNIGVFCLLGMNSVLMTFNYYEIIFNNIIISVFVLQYLLTMLPLVILAIYWTYQIMTKTKIWIDDRRKFKYKRQLFLPPSSLSSLPHSYCVWEVDNSRTENNTNDVINERFDSVDFIDFIEASGRLKTGHHSREGRSESMCSEDTSLKSVTRSPSCDYGSVMTNSDFKN